MSKYQTVPRGKEQRVGCKVSWQYYETEEAAKAASIVAKHNARLDAAAGYDFGYQSPGSIRPPQSDGKGFYPDLWEVCFS